MGYGFLAPAKKMRLVLLPALLTAMPAAAFAQPDAATPSETVVVTGSQGGPVCSLQLLNTVPMQIRDNVLTVPADINGKALSFQFGTAAIADQMTEAAARALGLTVGNMAGSRALSGNVAAIMGSSGLNDAANLSDETALEIYDSRGVGYANTVTVPDISLQALTTKDVEFHISPLPAPGTDGILDIETFQHFDTDLNFSARRLNFFSRDHCAGRVIYWRSPGAAALPFFVRDNRMVAHVTLDGNELEAVIDTGSPISALRSDAAARLFGLASDDPKLKLAGQHYPGTGQDLYAYKFKRLSFGIVTILNPQIALTKGVLVRGLNPNSNTSTRVVSDASEGQPDMIIGIDLLKLMHLYIAMGERILYVTQGPELAESDPNAQPVVPVTPFRP